MAKRQSAAAPVRVQPAEPTQTREATQAIELRRDAMSLIVTDKASHSNALEFVRAGKQLKRLIETHWVEILRADDEAKRKHLDQKRRELEPVLEAIETVEGRALNYANEQARIEREQADAARRKAEADAQAKRERELAEAEAAALKFEQDSPVLSAREQEFIAQFLFQDPASVPSESDRATRAAARAGYKDPKVGVRMIASQKIKDAIQAKRTANAIREQAAATRQQPLAVVQPKAEASQVAKASGVRTVTTRSAQVVDLDKLIDGVLAGTVSRKALRADDVFLNAEARQLADTFEAVYPGCRLIVRQGLAG